MHSERFFETVARTAPRGRCCDRPFHTKTPRVLNGNGCPAEAPYGCFLPDQIRNISSPEPIERARRAGDILPHFGCTSRESFFPQQRRDEKGIAAQRVGDTCTRVLGVATRRTRSDASTAPSPCAKPYFASTAAIRSQASINTERGLGTHMRWKNSPPSGSKLRPSCKMTLASS